MIDLILGVIIGASATYTLTHATHRHRDSARVEHRTAALTALARLTSKDHHDT